MNELLCRDLDRREAVRLDRRLNGLDYLEVGPDQLTLEVYFLGKAPKKLDERNLRIMGGERITAIEVVAVRIKRIHEEALDDHMVVTVDHAGDFSTYSLQVVARNAQGEWQPHPDFDPHFDRIAFSFKVDCPSELDCKPAAVCAPEVKAAPDISYLAKDYESFRRLILDRLALLMPEWRERHAPDIGIALVELLAYTGDSLSYYQDAIATEAYLATARRRISVRRHARLVDYRLHEGCNARAWICLETDSDLTLAAGTFSFITQPAETSQPLDNVIAQTSLAQIPHHLYEIFEPLRPQALQLYRDHNRIRFYTWGNSECCLPKGARHATLEGVLIVKKPPPAPPCRADVRQAADPGKEHQQDLMEPSTSQAPQLHLQPGDILIFQEMMGPQTGHPGDADPTHRHAVRLTRVTAGRDPLSGLEVVEINWAAEDALPFPLCLSSLGPPPDCLPLADVSLAFGNVLLVDHGASRQEPLGSVAKGEPRTCCRDAGLPANSQFKPAGYRPRLSQGPLTFSQALDDTAAAARLVRQDARQSLPQIRLQGEPAPAGDPWWLARADLLESGADAQHFVAEVDDTGRAHLRFGDDVAGEQPDAGMVFIAFYRVGNGPAGNVGAETIIHLVLHGIELQGADIRVRNPLPASGGTSPEPTIEAKLRAPHAFRQELQRAITAKDYADIVQRDFSDRVQRAVGCLRWTGSWYEMLTAVDPLNREAADPALLTAISEHLHRFRRMGHDLLVTSARPVSLDIAMIVCVLPHYLRGHVEAALQDLFSNRLLADGRAGLFHPDQLSFGEDVCLSRLVAAAQAITGVQNVVVTRLRRLSEGSNQELEKGVLLLGPDEIARMDNETSRPENGRLTLDMRGGR